MQFSYRRLEEQIYPENRLELSPFQDLPSDILHIILHYYANSISDIIRFSSICRECKETGSYSLLWLKYPLTVQYSREYLNFTFQFISYFKSVPKIVDIDLHDILSEDQLRNSNIKEIVVRFPLRTSKPSFELAHDIRQNYMRIFTQCQRYWYERMQRYLFYEKIDKFCNEFVDSFYGIFCLVVGILSQSFACYFFADFPQYPGSLTKRNRKGFVCLYFTAFLHVVLTLFWLEIKAFEFRKYYFGIKHRALEAIRILSLPLTALLSLIGLILTFFLLKMKFSSSPQLQFAWISIPFWISSVFGLVLCRTHLSRIDPLSQRIFVLLTVTAIPLTVLLAGLYFDRYSSSHSSFSSSLGYVFIPLYPTQIALIIILFQTLHDSFLLWRQFCCSHEDIVRSVSNHRRRIKCLSIFRLVVNLLRCISIVMMTGLMISVNVLSFLDRGGDHHHHHQPELTMARFMQGLALFFLSCQLQLYSLRFDDLYL
jgi:hypothetical protein